jgi:beta-lactamase class A
MGRYARPCLGSHFSQRTANPMIPRARFVPALSSALLFAATLLLPALHCQAQQVPIPDPPDLAARGYLLVDHDSGAILAESNADERLEPASLTKIMTAYVVFRELAEGKLSLDDEVLISEKAWRTGGSKMFVEVGKRVSVSDLLHGMIVQSGNDASVALAEHIAGTEATFAELMNSHAKRLGMNNTHFVNSPPACRTPSTTRRRGTSSRSPRPPSGSSPNTTPGTRCRTSPSTTSNKTTATGCSRRTRPSTASRPVIPRPPAIAWWPPRCATASG